MSHKTPNNRASNHDGMGTGKSPVNTGPSAVSFNDSFAWRLLVSNTDETDERRYKRKDSDLNQFEALQHPSDSLKTATDRLTQMENKTDTKITTVALDLTLDIGYFEYLPIHLQNKDDELTNTEVGAL